jgi:glucose/arabinose dehydrogenase
MEAEKGRAAIWVYDLASRQARVYAEGIRNPNGIDFEPTTGAMYRSPTSATRSAPTCRPTT